MCELWIGIGPSLWVDGGPGRFFCLSPTQLCECCLDPIVPDSLSSSSIVSAFWPLSGALEVDIAHGHSHVQCTRIRAHIILQRYDHVTAGTSTPRHASYSKLLHACKCVACMKNALARNSDRYCATVPGPITFPAYGLPCALRSHCTCQVVSRSISPST